MHILSIGIITYNTGHYLEKCLKSIYENISDISFKVYVVDNASSDGTAEMVKEKFPEVILIKNSKNLGCSKSRNQFLKQIDSKYVMILDSDTEIKPNSVEKMIHFADQYEDVGLFCPRLVSQHGNTQSSVRRFPGIRELLFRRMEPLFDNTKIMQKYYLEDKDLQKVQEVDYGISACYLVPAHVLKKSIFFDEKLFYGGEDIDFCASIRRAGYKIFFNPNVEVVHIEQRMTKKSIFYLFLNYNALKMFYYMITGTFYVLWKHQFFINTPKIS